MDKENILEKLESIKSEYEITQELLKRTVTKLEKLAEEYNGLVDFAKENGIEIEEDKE